MNVLIVDDQKNVVNGMKKGIHWENLWVNQVWTAYNSFEAKKIIEKEDVEILLCDIEMPGEDGLSLFRWAKQYNNKIECIFLTAHANFDFAKEAIKLGGCDYILQPAPYVDIEEAILRVCKKIHKKKEIEKYSLYGKNLYENKEFLLEGILKNWFEGNEREVQTVLRKLEEFDIYIPEDKAVAYCMLEINRWIDSGEKLESGLMKYAIENILSELLEALGFLVIGIPLEEYRYGFLFYQTRENSALNIEIENVLEQLLIMCKGFYGGIVSCYFGGLCKRIYLNDRITQVWNLKKDNVALQGGVFLVSENKNQELSDMSWMEKWTLKLIGGRSEEVKEEALKYLNSELNAKLLKQFYMKFMQIVATACDEVGISNYQIFSEKEDFEKSLKAYETIETMEQLVLKIVNYFQTCGKGNDDDYVEKVIQYIHCNVEKDIRRSELAQAIGLNEDYLSRIFKKEKGISLKEYIILEKMQVAQTLLKNTTFPISVIAAKVGFVNFSHFSQTYKKIMGKTPAKERS